MPGFEFTVESFSLIIRLVSLFLAGDRRIQPTFGLNLQNIFKVLTCSETN
jgi:hypothetical protein